MEKVSISEKLSQFSDHWNPRVVGKLNGQHVRLAKFQGDFVWHQHEQEDDPVQFEDPDFAGGANTVSLRQVQQNFAAIGCTEEQFLSHVRPPSRKDNRDPEWIPLEED